MHAEMRDDYGDTITIEAEEPPYAWINYRYDRTLIRICLGVDRIDALIVQLAVARTVIAPKIEQPT